MYKRQPQLREAGAGGGHGGQALAVPDDEPQAFPLARPVALAAAGGRLVGRGQHAHAPVSYTHLDVYKRQPLLPHRG